MENFTTLIITALSIGIFHTLSGPDHYLPFVAMSKVRGWSKIKTMNIVVICGMGHVLSSVVIGFIGIAAGITISKIEFFEGFRGNIAAWLMFIFGIGYILWGTYRLKRNKTHSHIKVTEKNEKKKMTFWILFTIFIFGPCEPLIPLLMYPAAEHNYSSVAIIALLFALVTVATMLISVFILLKGFSFVKLSMLEKYQHLLAGAAVTLCGASIIFLGL